MKTRLLGRMLARRKGCTAAQFTQEERADLEAVFPPDAAVGLRYPEEMMRLVNA